MSAVFVCVGVWLYLALPAQTRAVNGTSPRAPPRQMNAQKTFTRWASSKSSFIPPSFLFSQSPFSSHSCYYTSNFCSILIFSLTCLLTPSVLGHIFINSFSVIGQFYLYQEGSMEVRRLIAKVCTVLIPAWMSKAIEKKKSTNKRQNKCENVSQYWRG